jgi:hypothetical protein
MRTYDADISARDAETRRDAVGASGGGSSRKTRDDAF